MKIRFDFVTNSSSSSFVCIQFKSKKLKELLTKYDIPYWESDSKWDVVYTEEASGDSFGGFGSIDDLLDWFVEDFMCDFGDKGFVEEYISERETYYNDIKKANYVAEMGYYGEFGDDEESFSFEYTKPKKTQRKKPQVPDNLRESLINDLSDACQRHSNIEDLFPKYEEYLIKGEPAEEKEGYGWFLYDAFVTFHFDGYLYYKPVEKEYANYQEEMEAFLQTPLEDLDLDEVPLTWAKLYQGKENLQEVNVGDIVRLYKEPDHAKDPNAVFVTRMDGKYLGYISGERAAYIAPFLNTKKLCWRGSYVGEVFFFGRKTNGIKIELMLEEAYSPEDGVFKVETGKPE